MRVKLLPLSSALGLLGGEFAEQYSLISFHAAVCACCPIETELIKRLPVYLHHIQVFSFGAERLMKQESALGAGLIC